MSMTSNLTPWRLHSPNFWGFVYPVGLELVGAGGRHRGVSGGAQGVRTFNDPLCLSLCYDGILCNLPDCPVFTRGWCYGPGLDWGGYYDTD